MSKESNIDPNLPFKDEDLEEIIKVLSPNKTVIFDRGSKRILLELAQTFLEEVLDLPLTDKQNLSTQAITRQIGVKFPEASKEGFGFTIDYLQRRNMEIYKEEAN
jgi:hypothetical protein